MVTQLIQQRHVQPMVLVAPPAGHIAEIAYFASLLDMGEELEPQTDEMLVSLYHTAAAPTLAAYLAGLLDTGEE